jgi:two-component system CheB/CheR fusion protein
MDTTIVGIGSSAGGLNALTELLEATPCDTGFAFIIVHHMTRSVPSMMVDLLAKHTAMAVQYIKSGDIPAPNTVYVTPPAFDVTMHKGALILQEIADDQSHRRPIDSFLTSLAKHKGENAYALILSGTGSDGTIGTRAIKENGGITFAQQSDSAQFSGMPDSAIATGLIDFSLPANEIPEKLLSLKQFRERNKRIKNEILLASIEKHMPELLSVIESKECTSFHQYKPGTLVRRTLRRMTLKHINDIDSYLAILHKSKPEREGLVQDFLIGVTQFFRNSEMFSYIEGNVLSELLKRNQAEFRIWCPGCSTGEEVYSLAMLVHELQRKTGDQRPWKLFGTDIDHQALAKARSGTYDKSQVTSLSVNRRTQFLTNKYDVFTIESSIREMCVFAPHHALADPPFSRIDFISCRNLMIYFGQQAQEELITRFHYSLNPKGFLWLGPTENLTGNKRLFEEINRTYRVFRREETIASLPSQIKKSGFPISKAISISSHQGRMQPRTGPNDIEVETETEQAYLSIFSQPFARINQHDEVLYISERMRPFLLPAKGVPSTALDDYFVESLRMPLRVLLKTVRDSKTEQEIADVSIKVNGESRAVDILARPLDVEAKSILIVFQTVRYRDKPLETVLSGTNAEKAYEDALTAFRKKLAARDRDYQIAEEELRANNEELLTINEELQSSNEELDTSREELQSMNEELETINSELISNNKELEIANSHLKNLLESTDIATLFVDKLNRLKLFTPRCQDIFSIQDRDIGRSIFDLTTVLIYPELKGDLENSTKYDESKSREIVSVDNRYHYIVRMKPYLDVNGNKNGSVVSFFDITEQRQQQQHLAEANKQIQQRIRELETFYERAPIEVGLHGIDMRYVRVNNAMAENIGLPIDKIVGQHPADIVPDAWRSIEPIFSKIIETHEPVLNVELKASTGPKGERERTWIANYFPLIDKRNVLFGIGFTALDVTDVVQLKLALEQNKSDLKAAGARILGNFEYAPIGITTHKGPDHIIQNANQTARSILGTDDVIGQTPDLFFPEHYQSLKPHYDEVYHTGKMKIQDEVFVNLTNLRGDKIEGVFRRIIQPYQNESGQIDGVICMTLEITELVYIRDMNANQSLKLQSIINALDSQIVLTDTKFNIEIANQKFLSSVRSENSEIKHQNLIDHCAKQMDHVAVTRILDALASARDGRESSYNEVLNRHDDERLQKVVISVKPIVNEKFVTGNVDNIVLTIIDQTPLIEANKRKDILVAELEHRVKNVIATIQAVTEFTALSSPDVNRMNLDLSKRLSAMARTHGILTSSGWSNQKFSDLLALELQVYSSSQIERVSLEGDDLILSANSTMLVGLALHELLTNAVKYGALSNMEGEVLIKIKVKNKNLERFIWQEKNGPMIKSAAREGFGTLLLGVILPSELDGTGKFIFDSNRFTYELIVKNELTEEIPDLPQS